MQTWPLRIVGAVEAAVPPAGDGGAVVAGLIDAIGEPDFSERMLHHVNRLLPAGSLSAYILSREREPELVASATSERPDRTHECWQAYRSWLYRQDRTFDTAWQSPTGLVSHCTTAAFVPAHRAEIYERARSHERLSLCAPLDASRLLAVNFYRNLGQPGFSAADAGTVATIAVPLLACVRRQARLAAPRAAPMGVRERLQAHCPRLTERELDVLEHLSRGCTYDGVSAACGLARATVKTYRERAFLKLGIHFRSELYALLVERTPSATMT